jgi:hypothetical protein
MPGDDPSHDVHHDGQSHVTVTVSAGFPGLLDAARPAARPGSLNRAGRRLARQPEPGSASY